MNREEAIEWLKSLRKNIPLPKAAKSQIAKNEALDMGIKALQQPDWIVDELRGFLGDSYECIINDRKEFRDWLERLVWHVKECNKLSRQMRDVLKTKKEPKWIPCSERLPSKGERKEWIDKNLDGIGYLYPCLVTRYSSINPDRTKNNPYVAKHYFDGEDFLNAGEEVCSEYIIAWMPLPEPYKGEEE